MAKTNIPALVGRKEAAAILGMPPTNMNRNLGDQLPAPLQDRGIDGFEVSQTPLWPREEIEALADQLADRQAEREQRHAETAQERMVTDQRVLNAVTDDWQSGREIAEAAGVSVRGIGRRLKVFANRGLVENNRGGSVENGAQPLKWRRAR